MVICLGRGADLHMAQLMPLPLTTGISCCSKSRFVFLPFWYRLTQVVPDRGPLNDCCCLQASLCYFCYLQVDYEAIKHENRRLKEDLDDMSAEIEEIAKLKKIVEKNLEEALVTIVQEREQKHALKKELDQKLKTDSLYALQSLVNFGVADGRRNHDNVGDSPALKRIENEFATGDGPSETTASLTSAIPEPHSVVGDLFSEIHVAEVRKLEKLLEDVEIQKSELQAVLDDVQRQLRLAEEELGVRDTTIEQLKAQLSSPATSQPADGSPAEQNLQDQIDAIRSQAEIEMEGHTAEEITRLQNSTAEQEERIRRLEADLSVMSQLATETQGTLSTTQDSLVQVTEDIANLYHLVCEVNGETPNRLMLEHVRGKSARKDRKSKSTAVATQSGLVSAEKDDQSAPPKASADVPDSNKPGKELQHPVSLSDRGQSPEEDKNSGTEETRGDPIACSKLVETINDQIKFLRSAVERSVELSRQKRNESGSGMEETADMVEQIIKLKALLSAKREQVPLLLRVCDLL